MLLACLDSPDIANLVSETWELNQESLRTGLREVTCMRMLRLVQVVFVRLSVPALALTAGAFASAQAGGGDWQKSYQVPGKASLNLSSGDASVELRSCGDCREI